MPGPKLNLPPFAALRAFQAAATHARYQDAADSLGITESAVSHQIKKLEEFLHVSLFDRSGHRPKLTAEGQRYLAEIEPALQNIHAATEAIKPASGRAVVRLTLPPSLAAVWLIPQLGSFEQANPEIDLQLTATTRVVDLKRDQVDLAIRHGRGAWDDVDAEFLLAETAMPVCAPGYLESLDETPGQSQLASARLITNGAIPGEWDEWASANGVDLPAPANRVTLDAMEQALQVAERGHGIAMGRRPLVDDWLNDGRLIAPFGSDSPTGASYYLCRPTDLAPTAAGRRVQRWLMEVSGSA